MRPEQQIQVTGLRIGPQVAQAGFEVEWLLAPEALGAVSVPVQVSYVGEPALRTGEVVVSLRYPRSDGSTAQIEARSDARLGGLRLDFVPEAYGAVLLSLYYDDELYLEDQFSIGRLD